MNCSEAAIQESSVDYAITFGIFVFVFLKILTFKSTFLFFRDSLLFSAFCCYFGSYFITILHFYKKKKEVIDRESENAAVAMVKVCYLFWRLLKAQLINDVF